MKAVRIFFSSVVLVLSLGTSMRAQDPSAQRSFSLAETELSDALDSLRLWYAVPLIYLERDVADITVTAACVSCDLEAALRTILKGRGLRVTRIGDQIVIRREADDAPRSAVYGGSVIDSLTGEPVIGAIALLVTPDDSSISRWCMTGLSGFYSFQDIQPGDYVLIVRRIGYHLLRQSVKILPASSEVRDIRIQSKELVQAHVTVEGHRSAFKAADGVSRGIFIRSAPTDQHQYFLEGARIYNPVHLGGLTNAFNGDALHDVQAVAGGVPPFYGGRIGGILDVSLWTGDGERVSGIAETGSLTSGLTLKGPVISDASFVLSGRQSYPDILVRGTSPHNVPADLHTTELMFKLSQPLAEHQRLSATAFYSRDAHDRNISEGPGLDLTNRMRWWNGSVGVRWSGVAAPSLYFSSSLSVSAYGFDVGQYARTNGGPYDAYESAFTVQDASLRAHAEYMYDPFHTMLSGVELIRHQLTGAVNPFTSQLFSTTWGGPPPWELSVYLQDQWRLVPSVVAELGARATSFVAADVTSSSVDPRFSVMVLLSEASRVHGSISAVTQYLHPYRHSGVFLFYPSIFYYASGRDVPPSTSLHGAIGYEHTLDEDRYRLVAEGFYRLTRNLHEFSADTGQPVATDLRDVLLTGEGTSYGATLGLDKRLGDVVGTVRYSLTWSENRFDGLNNGQPFRPRFDRRHEVFADVTYLLSDDLSLGATCLLASDRMPFVGVLGGSTKSGTRFNDVQASFEGLYAEPVDLNGGRLPGFQRLEIRAGYAFSLSDLSCEATLRLVNGYGLFDPFQWHVSPGSDPLKRWRVTLDAPPLLPLYPALTLRVKF